MHERDWGLGGLGLENTRPRRWPFAFCDPQPHPISSTGGQATYAADLHIVDDGETGA